LLFTAWKKKMKKQKINTISDFKQRTAVNSLARYTTIGTGMITHFFLTPFLIGMLGAELLGLQTLSAQALGFAGLVSGALGVSYRRHATASFAKNDFKSMNMYLSIGFWVSCISAIVFLICTIGVAWLAQQLFGLPDNLIFEARIVIAITGTATAVHMVAGVFTSPAFIRQKLYVPEVATIVSTLTSAFGVYFAFMISSPSIIVWVLLANGCRVTAMLFITLPWCKKMLPEMKVFSFPQDGRKEFIALFQFGGFSLIGGLGYLLFYSTDSIMISNLNELGIGKVIYYNVAQRWDPIVRMGVGAFVMSLTPALISRYASNDLFGMTRILTKGTRYSLILGILPCVLLTVYAYPFLELWLGTEFATESAPVMQLIMSTMIVSIPGIIAYEALIATGHLGLAVGATVLGGVLNIVISISLVKFLGLGLIGIAIGSVSMLTLKNGLLTPWLVSRYAQIPLSIYLKEGYLRPLIATAVFLPIVILIRCSTSPTSLFGLFVILGCSCLLYALLVWQFTLLPNERVEISRHTHSIISVFRRDNN